MIELSIQQTRAVERIHDWLEAYRTGRSYDQVFRLFGYAGTGKTALIKYVAENVGGVVLFGAYTGKAARVMQRHGLNGARTIHSLCYLPAPNAEDRIAEIHLDISQLPEGDLKRIKLEEELHRLCKPRFGVNEKSAAYDANLIVIDECSMVDETLGHDLLAFHRPILVIGDPGQLPPIEGEGFFTKGKPDVMLTEIHRQAEESPIIQVATMAREGKRIPFGMHGLTVAKRAQRDASDGRYGLQDHLDRVRRFDQVVVGKNKTRRFLNKLIRKDRNYEHGKFTWMPTEQDVIIIRRNYPYLKLLNGDQVTLRDIQWKAGSKTFSAHIIREDGADGVFESKLVPIYAGRFMDHYDLQERREDIDYFVMKYSIVADFGYALTAHTAQGSQWPSVLVVRERMKGSVEDHRKWLYTAITRAEAMLMILE